MTALRSFLVGLTTRHLGSKLLALLLSIGLFSAVQLSQRGTKEIPELRLQLELAKELQNDYVLLTPSVPLKDIRIAGPRSKVIPLHRQYLQSSLQPITINDRFLRRYGDGLNIPITAALFKDEALMSDEIDVTGLQDGLRIKLDKVAIHLAVIVEVDPDTDLVLPGEHDYQGTLAADKGKYLLEPKITPRQVTLRGPSQAFDPTQPPRIVLDLGDLARELGDFATSEERDVAAIRNVSVKWSKGSIKPEFVEHVRIKTPSLGLVDAATFEDRLVVTCEVVRRKVKHEVAIPILRLVGKDSANLDEWASKGGLVQQSEIEAGEAEHFPLKMPESMKGNKPLLESLVLILNVHAAKEEVAGELIVPVSIRSFRPEFEADVAQIEIDGPDKEVKFRKQQ